MSSTIRVLHVDDEPDFADLAATMLEREDARFEVVAASSAKEGLTRLNEATFDCVVSDFDMPHQNGIEFLEAVREHAAELPFILFTGKGSEEIASDAISAGVSDYLQKGRGTDQYSVLANKIDNLVSKYRAESQLETRLEQQRRVAGLGKDALAGVPLETLFEEAVEIVADTLGNEYSKVLSYRPEYEDLLLRAGVGWRAGLVGSATVGTDDDSQAGHTIRSEEPIVVEDLRTEDRFSGPALLVDHNVVSGISVIIGSPADPWGVLGTHTTKQTRFTNDDITFVQSVANVLASAINRQAHERELTTERDFIEQALDALHDLFYVVDTDGSLRRWNDRVSEVTGYTDAELAEMQVIELFPEDDHATITDGIADTLTTGETVIEADIRTATGDRIPYEFTASHLTDPEGDLSGIIGIGREITDRKQRQQEQEQRYEAIFNHTYQFTGLMDPDGTLLEANETALEFGGLNEEDVIGKPFWEARWWQISEETQQELRDAIDRAAAGEFVRYDVEVQGEKGTIVIDFSIRPVTDENGNVTYLIPEGRNITELQSLRHREQELARQNERLEKFATVVSHDLRNPLNVAQGRLQLAHEECESEHLDDAINAVNRSLTLIDDLLTLARDGEAVSDFETVDLRATVEECWEHVQTSNATLLIEIDRSIRADADRLKQLLENLIRNAVEHGGDDVTITVGHLADGFYIADNGPGIPESDYDQVFEPGYTTSDTGTGFGLNIVHEIATAHNWQIHLTHSSDGGARFEITNIKFIT